MSNKAKTLEQIRELHRRFLLKCTDAAREASSPRVSLRRKLRSAIGYSSSRLAARLWTFLSL